MEPLIKSTQTNTYMKINSQTSMRLNGNLKRKFHESQAHDHDVTTSLGTVLGTLTNTIRQGKESGRKSITVHKCCDYRHKEIK